ncbi:hypothetical protein KUTeg_024414 [Tegillarca granosa]|uniref:Uncharacterized protein n=1 Tax=Tegillarca granosa TaxID=220873 RepID=A0ABQ9E3L1_TEGGR|nr:hypothetical protein KUTeg_024414 [Tegillarca granosa]
MEIPKPEKFCAYNVADADIWINKFIQYTDVLEWSEIKSTRAFPLFLENSALVWYLLLDDNIKKDFKLLCEAFVQRYGMNHVDRQSKLVEVIKMKQKNDENVTDFIARVEDRCYRANATCIMDHVIQHGEIKTPMLMNNINPKTTEEVITSAKIGQSVDTVSREQENERQQEIQEKLDKKLKKLKQKLTNSEINETNIAPAISDSKSDNSCTVNIRIGDSVLPALVDSGAAVSVVRLDVYHKTGHKNKFIIKKATIPDS